MDIYVKDIYDVLTRVMASYLEEDEDDIDLENMISFEELGIDFIQLISLIDDVEDGVCDLFEMDDFKLEIDPHVDYEAEDTDLMEIHKMVIFLTVAITNYYDDKGEDVCVIS